MATKKRMHIHCSRASKSISSVLTRQLASPLSPAHLNFTTAFPTLLHFFFSPHPFHFLVSSSRPLRFLSIFFLFLFLLLLLPPFYSLFRSSFSFPINHPSPPTFLHFISVPLRYVARYFCFVPSLLRGLSYLFDCRVKLPARWPLPRSFRNLTFRSEIPLHPHSAATV